MKPLIALASTDTILRYTVAATSCFIADYPAG